MRQIEREDLALKLFEDGLETDLLAERFRVKRPAVARWIRNAKERRSENATAG